MVSYFGCRVLFDYYRSQVNPDTNLRIYYIMTLIYMIGISAIMFFRIWDVILK
jgi:hypothetical protein